MTITVEQVIATLEEVVAEKGEDYVYETPRSFGCWYGDDKGNPSCIVGHVVAKLDPAKFQEFIKFEETDEGFGVDDFKSWDEDSEMDGRSPVLEDWDDESIEVLAAAQRVQDTQKYTWGEALTAAKAAL